MRSIARLLLSALFIVAGTLHLARAELFVRIVPPGFPAPLVLVVVSGICEILGGAGILLPAFRRAAGIGLLALLAAVFPANVFMAYDARSFADLAPPLLLWLRLPLQFALAAWVWYAAIVRAR